MRIIKHDPPPVQHTLDILGMNSDDFSLLLKALRVVAYPEMTDLMQYEKDQVKLMRTELIRLVTEE